MSQFSAWTGWVELNLRKVPSGNRRLQRTEVCASRVSRPFECTANDGLARDCHHVPSFAGISSEVNQMKNPLIIGKPPARGKVHHSYPSQIAKLKALEQFDLSFVSDRIVREKGTCSKSVAANVLGFKRFMGMAALGYRGLPVPSHEVDEVWHTFLLFTREYQAFCHKGISSYTISDCLEARARGRNERRASVQAGIRS